MHTNSHSHPLRIQVDFTKKHQKKFFFLVPNHKELTEISLAWTAKITNLYKQSEVSRDVLGYFLSCVYQPDDSQCAIITTNRCDRTIHHVCGISMKFTPARQLHNQPCILPEKPGSSQVLKHMILIPVSYYRKRYDKHVLIRSNY